MHVGAAACNKGDVAGPSICGSRVDAVGNILTAPVRALALGSCAARIGFRGVGGVKTGSVWYSFPRQTDWAQRKLTG